MLAPRRVVFIGGAGLEPAIRYSRAQGYNGVIDVVNPRRTELAGVTCVPSIEALPQVPDLAFIAVPKDAVIDTVAALARLGAGGAICNSSGFAESDAAGATRQAALVPAAAGMPVIGPNCPGMGNYFDHAVFMMDHFGSHAPARGVAVISNGGAYLSDLGCADRSLPIGYMIGMGNQAVVSMAEMLLAVLEDPRVCAVNLYLEGVRDVALLSHGAAVAARNGLPVVVVKGGRSDSGSRAAKSHTASLSGSAEIASALFRRFGWIEAHTPSEAIETLKMLSCTALPQGRRTAFITSSGSYAVLGADLAEREGLLLAPPSRAVAERVAPLLPDFVGPANPLDISTAQTAEVAPQLAIYQAFLSDTHDIALQVMCYPPAGGWDIAIWEATTQAFSLATAGQPAAFINTLPESLPRLVRERLALAGVAPLQGLADGMRAVGHAIRYGAQRDALRDRHAEMILPVPEPVASNGTIAPAVPAQGTTGATSTSTGLGVGLCGAFDEAQAKSLLAAAGLRVPASRVVCGDLAGVSELRFPVALKALAGGQLHKSEVDAVALGITSAGALLDAIAVMQQHMARHGIATQRFLVEEMVTAAVAELLVGLRREPGIGLVLTLAIGGVAVELLQDTATLLLPATPVAIGRALQSLRLYPLLTGWRGRAAVSLDATLGAIEGLANFCAQHPEVSELEINPLMLTPTAAWIADAVLRVDAPDTIPSQSIPSTVN
ncbi:MAG: acetate--CoA ligase family protein [Burkholderiaceae bacterium]